jgi:hypothetical protein
MQQEGHSMVEILSGIVTELAVTHLFVVEVIPLLLSKIVLVLAL